MAGMHVELVAVERPIWSGDASMVIARTTEGELGILPGHIPLLGELAPGAVVRIKQESGEELTAAVHGGFLSVTQDGVSILAEIAELSDEIDVPRAESALERARSGGDDADAAARKDAEARATSRLRAAGQTV